MSRRGKLPNAHCTRTSATARNSRSHGVFSMKKNHTHGVDAIAMLEILQNVSCLRGIAQCHVHVSEIASKVTALGCYAYPAKIVNFTKRASVLTLRFSFCREPATISTSSTNSQPSSREDGDCSLQTATCSRRTARATAHKAPQPSCFGWICTGCTVTATARGQGSRTVSARDRDLLQVLHVPLLAAHNDRLREEPRGHPTPLVIGLNVRDRKAWLLRRAFVR